MEKVRRKLLACARLGCNKCPLNKREIDFEDCEYVVKHQILKQTSRFEIRDRGSGKTSSIIRVAMELTDGGYRVIIFVPNQLAAFNMQRTLMGSGITVMKATRGKIGLALAGGSFAVLSDEVGRWIEKEVENEGHHFVMGLSR